LEQAEVVVYDYLANPELLDYCPRAEKIYVGKKAASHTMTQDEINQLLVDLGKRGKRVVRLKGGTRSFSEEAVKKPRRLSGRVLRLKKFQASRPRSPGRHTRGFQSPIVISTPASRSSPATRRKRSTRRPKRKPAAGPQDRRTLIGVSSPSFPVSLFIWASKHCRASAPS